jgi:hypothetical protein
MIVERHSHLSGNKMIMFLPLFFPIITSSDIKLAKKVRRSHLHSQHKRKKRKRGR